MIPTVPSEVVGVFFGEIDHNSVQIYWSKPESDQPITEYEITLKLINQKSESDDYVAIPTTHKVRFQ